MGTSSKDTGAGGSRLPDVGPHIFDHHICIIALWSRYIGGDTLNCEVTGGLPSKGGATNCEEAVILTIQQDMGLPPDGIGHVDGGIGGVMKYITTRPIVDLCM